MWTDKNNTAINSTDWASDHFIFKVLVGYSVIVFRFFALSPTLRLSLSPDLSATTLKPLIDEVDDIHPS